MRIKTLLLATALLVLGLVGTAQANNVQISGSMEGHIVIANGDLVCAGYSFKLSAHPDTHVLVANMTATITGKCSNGGTDTLTIPLRAGDDAGNPWFVAASNNDWMPTGDEQSPDSFQQPHGFTASVCGGAGTLDGGQGATFAGELQADQTASDVDIRFHYRDPNAKGKGNSDCSVGMHAADVCGASWTGTAKVKPSLIPTCANGGLPAAQCNPTCANGGLSAAQCNPPGGGCTDANGVHHDNAADCTTTTGCTDASGVHHDNAADCTTTTTGCTDANGVHHDNAADCTTATTGCTDANGVHHDNAADCTGSQVVLGARATPGAARLLGPTGCASKAFNARVRGSKMATVVFTLDGKVVKRVTKVGSKKLVQLRVNPASLRLGVHRLKVSVTFAKGSGTKAKTLRLSFQRCGKRLVSPRFTG